jgi:uncharacterized protein (TIGR04222 family)
MAVNPFDWRGPEFLVFYLILSACVVASLELVRRALESAAPVKMDLADPYLVAYLRGGENEVLRVAVVSLIDRGLLIANGNTITRAPDVVSNSVRRAIDKALLQKFATSRDATSIFDDTGLKIACQEYESTLKRNGLLPDDSVQTARAFRFFLAAFILILVGGVKLFLAVQRGRTNVGILIILIIVATIVAAKIAFPRLTASGRAMLDDIQRLYADLKSRAAFIRPGGATIEAAMLAATFGISSLEGAHFAYTRTLFPRAANPKKTSSWTTSCSSGCGTSSASSCGSSCGGGGCGGGCGGCGS